MKKPYYQSELRAEKDFEEYGCKREICSGSMPDKKLDNYFEGGKLVNYRLSNKHTFAGSFSVNLKDWDKDKSQAQFMGCKLLRRVEIEDSVTGKLRKFIILEQDNFKELLLDD